MKNEIEEFIAYLRIERKLSDSTIRAYKYTLYMIKSIIQKELISLNSEDIEKYLTVIKSKKQASSINHEITVLNEFYKYNNIDVMKNIYHLKVASSLPKYLTIEEVNNLLNIKLSTAYDYRNKAILELMYATGLRVSELRGLKLNDVDTFNSVVRVIGKGNKERIVPIGNVAIKYLNIYLSEYRDKLLKNNIKDEIFVNNHGNKLTTNGINYILKKISKDII